MMEEEVEGLWEEKEEWRQHAVEEEEENEKLIAAADKAMDVLREFTAEMQKLRGMRLLYEKC